MVTDERFTRRDNFISSDYMLERVGYDPAQAHKRLGTASTSSAWCASRCWR
ncbi:hypothetical protein M5585_15270 [Serratia ureilytica]